MLRLSGLGAAAGRELWCLSVGVFSLAKSATNASIVDPGRVKNE